jgi:hypothetical protein
MLFSLLAASHAEVVSRSSRYSVSANYRDHHEETGTGT